MSFSRRGALAGLGLAWCRSAHAATATVATKPSWPRLPAGSVVLVRHAHAPGFGDPAGFKLEQCSTQRNLDDAGRSQARRLGEAFRRQGVEVRAVWSSQWCRARETADLAFPGLRRDEPAFNSFFNQRAEGERQTREAAALVTRWRGPGVLVVVTHQVNITALTGVVPGSGEGVALRFGADARMELLGRLPAP